MSSLKILDMLLAVGFRMPPSVFPQDYWGWCGVRWNSRGSFNFHLQVNCFSCFIPLILPHWHVSYAHFAPQLVQICWSQWRCVNVHHRETYPLHSNLHYFGIYTWEELSIKVCIAIIVSSFKSLLKTNRCHDAYKSLLSGIRKADDHLSLLRSLTNVNAPALPMTSHAGCMFIHQLERV